MADALTHLVRCLAVRPAQSVLGWRNGLPLSNRAFLARVLAWQQLLAKTPGQQVALYDEDSLEFGAALLGAWHAGKTVWLSADKLPASCSALAGRVDRFLGQFDAQWQPLRPEPESTTAPLEPLEPLAQMADWPALDAGFVGLVVHTSGSTGVPQPIAKRLGQLAAELDTLERVFGARLGQADIIATVSHQHIYGLLFRLLWPLLAGRAIYAESQSFPEQLAPLLAKRACVLVASPAHLKRLPEHVAWAGAASMLRAVFSSGGPLAAGEALAVGQLLGQTPVEVYGSSETGGIAWRERGAAADDAWQPLPQVQWRIDPEGLLEVRSPHLEHDHWLKLADRVSESAAGAGDRFLLNGRSDRIVKIEEKRVSLDAVEGLLAASDWVETARVLLEPQVAEQRQRLAAFVVPSAQGRALLASAGKLALNQCLRAVLATALEPVALPRRWRYLDALPYNAAGKTSQAQLLALLEPSPDWVEAQPLPQEQPQQPLPRLQQEQQDQQLSQLSQLPQVRLLERSARRVLLELVAPADLIWFVGHFPDAAILPGVVLVDWAIGQGRQYFALLPDFRAMHGLKFQHVIRPDCPITLELLHDADKGNLNFRYFSPLGQHASGRIVFTATDHQE